MAPIVGFRTGITAACVSLFAGHAAAQRSITPPSPGSARVVLSVDKSSFFLGENVLLHYCLENTSTAPFAISVGEDYRGSSRSLRFKMTITDEQGAGVADPDSSGYSLGGIGTSPTLAPGALWCQSLPLMRYARIERAGTYDVRVVHDLGWPTGQAPEGRVLVTLVMPTAAEAEQVVAVMEALPTGQGTRIGSLGTPYQDFSTLRYPVYLAALMRRAQAGQAATISGLGAIPALEARQALINLLGHVDQTVARAAQRQLAMRLPDPALAGALPARSPFMNNLSDPRRYLRDASWRPAFAPEVRVAGTRLLASSDVQDVIQGAFMIEAVGDVGDSPALSSALTRAIERTLTLPPEPGIYPRPRGAVQELLRAADVLVARGYSPGTPIGESGSAALWLVALGQGARPVGWEAEIRQLLAHRILYVRELALDRLPADLPASLIDAVGASLKSSGDVDVQIAACRLVARATIAALQAPVITLLQTAKEWWLINAAANALYALGANLERVTIEATRLTEVDVADRMLSSLVGLLESNGHFASGAITAEQGRALSARWLAFIAAHRADIDASRRISLDAPDVPTDLVPPGWTLHRTGKPDWPPRGR